LVFFAITASAQISIVNNKNTDELINSILYHIYNLEHENARQEIFVLKKIVNDHPCVSFLEAMNLYWEAMPITAVHPKFPLYQKALSTTLQQSEKYLQFENTKLEAYFFKLAAHSSLAVAYVKAGDYYQSLLEARKTYSYMKYGFNKSDKLSEFYFTNGLYFFYAKQYPETHAYYKPFMWFFESGDELKGLDLLKKGTEQAVFTKTECYYFLAHIYLKYYSKPELSLPYSNFLIQKYPNNLFFLARNIEALIMANKLDEAVLLLPKLHSSNNEYYNFLYNILSGWYYQKKGNFEIAIKHYNAAIQYTQTYKNSKSDFLAYAHMGLSQIYYIKKNKQLFEYHLSKLEEKCEYKLHRQVLNAFKSKKT
jgi:tetratricopeptide (TPR) repeat protein